MEKIEENDDIEDSLSGVGLKQSRVCCFTAEMIMIQTPVCWSLTTVCFHQLFVCMLLSVESHIGCNMHAYFLLWHLIKTRTHKACSAPHPALLERVWLSSTIHHHSSSSQLAVFPSSIGDFINRNAAKPDWIYTVNRSQPSPPSSSVLN